MKTKPILFSTEMVQAILEGRKTQTRRVVKDIDNNYDYLPKYDCFGFTFLHKNELSKPEEEQMATQVKSPYGNVGDILWVREKFRKLINCKTGEFAHYSYYADMPEKFHKQYPSKHKPSIHMPKAAARIFLKITNVRVERLYDISESDAIAEGIECEIVDVIEEYRNYMIKDKEHVFGKNSFPSTPQASFSTLWEKIYGTESVNSNPWVWVVEFERVEKPLNF